MKDRFSQQSDNYALYRPSYPTTIFEYLQSKVVHKTNAWDCGTGNGQAALHLANLFENVFGTDISKTQLENAFVAENIHYSVAAAEKTNFPDDYFDLILIAQAIHWFDFEAFYKEVRRTGKKDALICVLGYGRVQVSEEIDRLIDHFYFNVLGPYWDRERKYIDENYQSIPFPFKELAAPPFESTLEWSLEHFIGYLNTWSAVRQFIKQNNYNPIENLCREIERFWERSTPKKVSFPILLRIGKIR